MISKEQKIKEQTDKLKNIEISSMRFKGRFKGHYQASGKATKEWEKILTNHISDMGLISRIYKELL